MAVTRQEQFDIEVALMRRLIKDDPTIVRTMTFAHWVNANVGFLKAYALSLRVSPSPARTMWPDQVHADNGEDMRIKNAKHVDWRNLK